MKITDIPGTGEVIYRSKPGTQRNRLEWKLSSANRDISEAAPQAVQDAVARCLPTAFAYRPDASTLSNNSTSIHCYFYLEFWISLTKEFPAVHGLPTDGFLNETLTRWLTGGPSYASGANPDADYLFDEEYTHSMTTPLYALSEYLLMPGLADGEVFAGLETGVFETVAPVATKVCWMISSACWW